MTVACLWVNIQTDWGGKATQYSHGFLLEDDSVGESQISAQIPGKEIKIFLVLAARDITSLRK